MKDKEKELKYLIYLKSQIIEQSKKELLVYKRELKEINKAKTLSKVKK